MKNVATSVLVLSLALLMSACGPFERKKSLNPSFGNAVRHNMQVQIVNPDAGSQPAVATEMDGARAASAYGRYVTGTSRAPVSDSASGKSGSKK